MSDIHTPDWVKHAVFYQIFPDRFAKSARLAKPSNLQPWDSPPTIEGYKGGDLLGVVEHLDHIQELGATAIYFTPIFQSTANHRYHTHDYHHVDPILGGDWAFRELLDLAHRRNMRVVIDGVFNHTGRGFYQFNHILENGAASPYVDWFYIKGYPLHAYEGKPLNYEAWWGIPALPKLNTTTLAVRHFLFDVAEYWIRQGIDGWRLDVPGEIDDDSFWQEFRQRVKAINPNAYIVGEIWHEAQRWLKGDQFDAVMNYPITLSCLGFFGAKTIDLEETRKAGGYRGARPLDATDFAEHIDRVLGWYDPQITLAQLNLLDSHDTPRFLSSVSGDQTALRLSYLFLFAYPGAPCIYYGDEIGLLGKHDPHCRNSFPWDESKWDHDLRGFVQRCIALRKSYPALRRGSYHRLYAHDEVVAFARWLGDEKLIIVLNASTATKSIDLSLNSIKVHDAIVSDVWNGGTLIPIEAGQLRDVKIAPRSGCVLKVLPVESH